MASVSIERVEKAFGSTKVIHGVDVGIEDGEFCVLVGPSGCGKSTLLRMIAGLEEISGGRISIGGKVVNDVPPKERDIAMVFQNYALYPHMKVRDNMAFALMLAKRPQAEIDRRVSEAASILGLEPYLDRYPRQLSGGQRQRVAMGRAIVRDPQVFLFDEPLSNLDAKLRVSMREEIQELHKRLDTTMVYVTHDQIEAMTLADRIVILNDGRIEQVGAPGEVFDAPANVFVAQFIGSPSMNLFDATATVTGFAFPSGHFVDWPSSLDLEPGQKVRLGIRPEDLSVGETGIQADVALIENTGADLHLVAIAEGTRVNVSIRGRMKVTAGDRVRLGFDPTTLHVFDAETGKRLNGPVGSP